MRIELSCQTCGGNSFTLDDANDDASIIECRDCGHVVGSLAQLKERIARQVLKDKGS